MEIIRSYKAVKGSIARSVVFTLGHFILAALVISIVTGAPLHQAVTASVIEPIINGLWYFVLDRLWHTNGN